jgi:hypothetical protein
MDNLFPLVPKSNSKLLPGYFWPIKLSNGHYACGVVLEIPLKAMKLSRTFYAGLLNWTGEQKPTKEKLETFKLKIIKQGIAHIKTITSRNESIEGHIDLGMLNIEVLPVVDCGAYSHNSYVMKGFSVLRKATPEDHQMLKTQSTWGYNVINIEADRFFVNSK